jgi:hypothetical protein
MLKNVCIWEQQKMRVMMKVREKYIEKMPIVFVVFVVVVIKLRVCLSVIFVILTVTVVVIVAVTVYSSCGSIYKSM